MEGEGEGVKMGVDEDVGVEGRGADDLALLLVSRVDCIQG